MPPVQTTYGGPAPQAGRSRRVWLVWVITALAAVLSIAGAVIVAVGLSNSGGCGSSDWVTDDKARLCYPAPSGWTPQTDGDFIMSITSMAGADAGDDRAAMVLAGQWKDFFKNAPERASLEKGAQWLARSFAEFFFPDPGDRKDETTRVLTVGDHRAATASFRIDFTAGKNPPTYIRATVVEMESGKVSFLFGAAPADDGIRGVVDDIHDELTVRTTG